MGVEVQALDKRAVWPALRNGTACKCPKCGKGNLFRAYLKVNDVCPNCGEELFHHRADDAPPYIAIVIVGHIIIFAMLHMEMVYRVPPITYLYTMVPLGIVLPLLMLPSIKGFIVGLQWANRMHGFDPRNREEEEAY